jgi:hypothetical protein
MRRRKESPGLAVAAGRGARARDGEFQGDVLQRTPWGEATLFYVFGFSGFKGRFAALPRIFRIQSDRSIPAAVAASS